MKRCTVCGCDKALSEFGVVQRKSGPRPRPECRSCTSVRDKKYREENKATLAVKKRAYKEARRKELAAKQREYYQLNRMALAEAKKKREQKDPQKTADMRRAARCRHAAKHPERQKARTTMGNAIRDGKLIRLPCEVCGDPKSHGHHDDYTKPLDVRWLCFKHHYAAHGKCVVEYESSTSPETE